MSYLKYTEEEFKEKILQALENSGYYTTKWEEEGGKIDRESMGYYQGKADAILELYDNQDFKNSREVKRAYQNGVDKYFDEQDNE